MHQSVSVAMAVYNGLPFLEKQLASILSELRPEDELVIVDDHSTDGSLPLLRGLVDRRIVLLTNERNLGVSRSFERALGACTHPIVLLCDQDDIWIAGKRDALVAPFERDPKCTAAVSDAEVIDGNGTVLSSSFMASRGGFKGGWWDTLMKNRYLGCCMALRRDVVQLGLPIPAKAPMHDMWFGMLAAYSGRVHYVARPYLKYRRHGKNVSPDRRAPILQMMRWRWNLLFQTCQRIARRHLGRGGLARTPGGKVGRG
jgi:glycosyltransferase involved in cell wall biosynthesis